MKKFLYPAVFLILVAGAFLAGYWSNRPEAPPSAATGGRRILYYVDPMNPAHTSDKPGIAPCGMEMVPVYADDAPAGQAPAASASMPPGAVKVSFEKQQAIGVRVGVVEKQAAALTLRTFGKVAADENRVYRIVSPLDGWVREMRGGTTGSFVKKDQVLCTYYSRDMQASIQSYLYALNAKDRYRAANPLEDQVAGPAHQLRIAEAGLLALGMSETQVKEIERTRKPPLDVELRSPVTGFVQARAASPKLRFERNTELYRIVDLKKVWVVVDLFENEAQFVRPGSEARIVLPSLNKVFHARLSDILPQFDEATRTLKGRLEVDNPEFLLRPDLFVDVEFLVRKPEAISVPVDAVVDSGMRKTVFVDRGNGFFEPRRVETGWRSDGRVEITGGLMAGERIVVSGVFMMDSESRMRLAASGGQEQALARDPVCGMEVEEGKANTSGWQSEYAGKSYYFCSEQCKREFDNAPERFVGGAPPLAEEKHTGHGQGHAHQTGSETAPAGQKHTGHGPGHQHPVSSETDPAGEGQTDPSSEHPDHMSSETAPAEEGHTGHGPGHAHQMPSEAAPAGVISEMSADEVEKALEGMQIEPPAKASDAGGQASGPGKIVPEQVNPGQGAPQASQAAEGQSHD